MGCRGIFEGQVVRCFLLMIGIVLVIRLSLRFLDTLNSWIHVRRKNISRLVGEEWRLKNTASTT